MTEKSDLLDRQAALQQSGSEQSRQLLAAQHELEKLRHNPPTPVAAGPSFQQVAALEEEVARLRRERQSLEERLRGQEALQQKAAALEETVAKQRLTVDNLQRTIDDLDDQLSAAVAKSQAVPPPTPAAGVSVDEWKEAMQEVYLVCSDPSTVEEDIKQVGRALAGDGRTAEEVEEVGKEVARLHLKRLREVIRRVTSTKVTL